MTYLIVFLVVPLVLGLGAQAWVKRSFAAGSKIQASSGMTGAQVSQRMLDASGIHDVSVEGISGSLSDHYDPRSKTMRLSEPVGGSTSVAAVAVAAHETGHAIQDAHHEAGFPLPRRPRAGRRIRVQRLDAPGVSRDSSSRRRGSS